MKPTFFWSMLVIQLLLAAKALPTWVFPVPDMISVASGFLVFIPLFWIFLNERGYRAFLWSGVSLVACFLPAVVYMVNIQAPFSQGIYLFITAMFFVFMIGALIGWLLTQFVVPYLRWAAVLLMPLFFSAEFFLVVILSTHSGLIPPPTFSPASALIAFPPLIQMASFTGVFGVDFLVLFVSAVLAFGAQEISLHWSWLRKVISAPSDLQPLAPKSLAAAGGIALSVLIFLGALFLAGNLEAQRIAESQKNSPRSLTVALLQPNLALNDGMLVKAANEKFILEQYRTLVAEASRQHAELLVFPEDIWSGSLPAENNFWLGLRSIIREAGCFAVAGMLTQTDDTHLYNRWYLLDRRGEILEHYDKRYLIPFGEYIPYRPLMDRLRQGLNLFITRNYQILKLTPLTKPIMDISPGAGEKLFTQGKNRYFIKICDEVQFPQYFREGVRLGGEAVFSPATGEWFRTPLYLRHFFALTSFRAVETRRWIGRTSSF
ncbi:MAG: hypothetical protein HGA76_08830, partial [Candidatus Firestonebacteria bacterium]|nr:hypothetical protein [Candidatus Firestonebacteria bacterium]